MIAKLDRLMTRGYGIDAIDVPRETQRTVRGWAWWGQDGPDKSI